MWYLIQPTLCPSVNRDWTSLRLAHFAPEQSSFNSPSAADAESNTGHSTVVKHIFCYGTLRDDDNSGADWTKDWVKGAVGEPAFVTGALLYQQEGVTWPYVYPTGAHSDRVHGRLLHWEDGDTLKKKLADADDIEDYNPDNPHSLYRRKVVQAFLTPSRFEYSDKSHLPHHESTLAYIYYQTIISPNSSLVPAGDWLYRHFPWPKVSQSVFYLLKNGAIYTSAHPEKVHAMVVNGGRIEDIGDEYYLIKRYPQAIPIDLRGNTVIPGLVDSHAHLADYGYTKLQVDLTGTTSLEQAIDILVAYAKNLSSTDTWIQGGGWDETIWNPPDLPTRQDLDAAFPDRPVLLDRLDGHAIWVNSRAIELSPPIPDEVPGGTIVRDPETNEPTGIFVDAAMSLITAPAPTAEDDKQAILTALPDLVRSGLTGVHIANMPARQVGVLKQLIYEGKLPIRVYGMLSANSDAYCSNQPESKNKDIIYDYGDGHLSVRAVKLFMDGALGSRGAALLEPYSDAPNQTGNVRMSQDELQSEVNRWVKCGYQVCTHAIGDRANRMVLDAYENVPRKEGQYHYDLRLRVEHAQILTEEDIPRFAKLHVLPSMQPTHATSDMNFAEQRLGSDRIKFAYAWQSLLQTGGKTHSPYSHFVLPFGSDFPYVGFVNPFWGIYAAITRQNASGWPAGGWYPEQRVDRLTALKGYTSSAAYASFLEHDRGTLTYGQRADFVILAGKSLFDNDTDSLDLYNAQVIATVVGGHCVYQSEKIGQQIVARIPGCEES